MTIPAALVTPYANRRRLIAHLICIPMPYLQTLRLFFSGVANDYRLLENHVEFRPGEGKWRILSDSDIELHYRFKTEVAKWHHRQMVEANSHAVIARS